MTLVLRHGGPRGLPGTPIELRMVGDTLQWRHVGGTTWTDLYTFVGGGGGMDLGALAAALVDTSTVDWTYDALASTLTAVVPDGGITNAKVATGISLDKTVDTGTRVAMTPAERTKVAAAAVAADITAAVSGLVPNTRTVAGKPLSADVVLVKGDVGLGLVDNTADASKPVSTAQQTALNLKADATALAAKADTTDPRFTDERTPVNGSVVLAKINAALISPVAASPGLRALGTGFTDAANGAEFAYFTGTTFPALDTRLAAAEADLAGQNDVAFEGGLQASTAGGITTVRSVLGPSTILARLAAGDVVAATPAEGRTLLDVDSKFESAIRIALALPLRARLTSTFSLAQSSTTPQDLTGLSVNLLANTSYHVQAFILYLTTTIADLKLNWTVPTGTTGLWSPGGLLTGASGHEGGTGRGTANFQGSATRVIGGIGAAVASASVEGVLTTTDAGTLQLQASQNTSEATTTEIRAQSILLATAL